MTIANSIEIAEAADDFNKHMKQLQAVLNLLLNNHQIETQDIATLENTLELVNDQVAALQQAYRCLYKLTVAGDDV